ncbi:MAG: NAD(P)H-hydrate dehydratase [Verrucomicrobia bacterium]|nr:MAG: NAD(P)H-hydrate dehydratase [Verrucomicrobiota bacterium]
MPIPVLSIAEMRRWEQATWATGQTEQAVIEQVGRLLAARLLRWSRPGDRILILAGKGHNGDDARCSRPHLEAAQREVELVNVRDPEADLAAVQTALGRKPAWVVDGLFGIGLNRPLAAEWQRLIAVVNDAGRPVLAVDVPSGLDADTGRVFGAAIRAAITVTLGAPKTGLLAPEATPHVGRLVVEPHIGLTDPPTEGELQWILPEDFAGWPPPRPVDAHKGTFGHALLLAGSPGYHGAAVLAARAAQRARPGLISLFTDAAVYGPVASQLQAVMVHAVGDNRFNLPEKGTALLVGPGLAAPNAKNRFAEQLLSAWRTTHHPVVVDASALDWLAPRHSPPRENIRVLTPHPGEAARLLRSSAGQVQADRLQALRTISAQRGHCWVILKGRHTLIGRSEGPVYVNGSGNPDLAQGGAGDILAGLLVGYLAQPELQADPARTLALAVWQHGEAADRLTAAGRRWVPEELVDALGDPPEA